MIRAFLDSEMARASLALLAIPLASLAWSDPAIATALLGAIGLSLFLLLIERTTDPGPLT